MTHRMAGSPLDPELLALWSQVPDNDLLSAPSFDDPPIATDCGGLQCFSMTCLSCAALAPMPPTPLYCSSRTEGQTLSQSPGSTVAGGRKMQKEGADNPRMQKRLARKAELARESRKRKKAYIAELEEKIDKLQYRIAEMEEQIALKALKGDSRLDNTHSEPQSFGYRIDDVDSLDSAELATVISNFEKVTLGKKFEVEECLGKVRNAVTPSRQIKFILWAFDQKDSFYDGPGLWQSLLARELACTDETIAALKSMRDGIRKDRRVLQDLDLELTRLSQDVSQYFNLLGMLIVDLSKIMTSKQLAKFIAWVENSEWCMQMLDSLWSSVFEREF